MKFLLAAAAAATLLPAVALAQSTTNAPTGAYGTLGYADAHTGGQDLSAIQGRVGYRALPWLGVEGEFAAGIGDDKSSQTVSGVTVDTKTHLKDEEAIYGVGFLSLAPNFDLLGRVGYGHQGARVTASASDGTTPVVATQKVAGDSWNYGVGAQYFFDDKNGVRGDYTHQEFTNGNSGHADVWALAYTRRF